MGELRSFFHGLWRVVDGARRLAVNLLFVGLLVILLATALAARAKVPSGAALVVRPQGAIVEQLAVDDPFTRLIAEGLGAEIAVKETLLKDLLDAIRGAKDDVRIRALFLDLGDMTGAGMTKLDDLRDALLEFRATGKKVVAYSDAYGQSQYFLAAHADEVYLHPDGYAVLHGFGRWRNYYKDGLDRLGVEIHVFRVGEYKSFVEPLLRRGMSPESREMSLDVYGDLWRSYLASVASAREVDVEEITATIDALPERLRATNGDLAKLALETGLVDRLAPRDEARQRMIDLVGENDDARSFRQVSHAEYLRARGGDPRRAGRGSAVAVVVAKGDILDGSQPPGTIGGDSTSRLIRRARSDDAVKALVLRVDSGGGSAFASEVIRRECELARDAGKPLVVSMGSVAASGGYWISTASDEIWANPDTITGSIGIFGIYATVHKPLAKYLGIRADGVGTTRFTDALRPDRPLDPALADALQQAVEHGYQQFLSRVGQARHMTPERVDEIGRGRIWSGRDAKALGLVDRLGGLDQAIVSAAKRAKLGKDYRVVYIQQERTLRQKVLQMLAGVGLSAARALGGADERATASIRVFPFAGSIPDVGAEAERLSRWNDPRGLYAHCLCGEY